MPRPLSEEGCWLGLAAGNPRQSTQSLPSNALAPPEDTVSEEAKTMAWWHLPKQRLIQTLLVSSVRGHWGWWWWGLEG